MTTERSHWLTLVLSPPPDVSQGRLGQQTHPELLTARNMVNDIVPGVVRDVLHQQRPWSMVLAEAGQLHPEVSDVLVGVDVPAQANTGVVPGNETGYLSCF